MAKQNPRQFWKRVRRDGRWITINTKTGKEVTRKDRIAAKNADRQDRRDLDEKQRKPLRERTVWSDELTDKGKLQTVHKSNKTYRKETSKWGDGDGDADRMTPEQQKKALKISKKRDLTNIPVKDGLKVNKSENKDSSNKNSSNKEKLKSGKMHSIEKKNRKIHGDTAVDRLKQKHKEWKKARKEGKLDEWKKKWGKK